MALSKETAQKIVEAVIIDADCQRIIEPNPSLPSFNPGTDLFLRFSHLAGSVRNAAMMMQGKYTGDKEFDEKICLGIALVTFKAVLNAIKQGRLPEVHTANSIHRIHWGIHHEATWIRMKDDSEYVFDWHATLKLRDPAISKAEDWMRAQTAINFFLFSGFK
jgi:hypothetical protein